MNGESLTVGTNEHSKINGIRERQKATEQSSIEPNKNILLLAINVLCMLFCITVDIIQGSMIFH